MNTLLTVASLITAVLVPLIILRSMKKSLKKYDDVILEVKPTLAKLDGSLDFLLNASPLVLKISGFADYLQNLLSVRQDETGELLVSEDLAIIGRTIGAGVAQSLKATLMGQLSGVARLDKGLEGAIAADVLDETMPIMGLIDQFTGINTKAFIKKNPKAALQLAKFAAPFMQNLQNKGGGGSSW